MTKQEKRAERVKEIIKSLCDLETFKKIEGWVLKNDKATLRPLNKFNYSANSRSDNDLAFIETV